MKHVIYRNGVIMLKMRNLIVYSVFLSTIFLASCACEAPDDFNFNKTYFALETTKFTLEVEVNENNYTFEIHDRVIFDKIYRKYYRKCFASEQLDSLKITEELADCPPEDLSSYKGNVSKKEVEAFNSLLTTDKIIHYFQVACLSDNGCNSYQEESDFPNRFRLGHVPEVRNYQGYSISWSSVDKIEDGQFKKLIQTFLKYNNEIVMESRKNNAAKLKKYGIEIND